jgi:hypothetical protein
MNSMAPTKIMFIRHGEKPPDAGGPPFGFDIDGNRDSHSLIARGWARTGALVAFFASPHAPIETPNYVFAATPDTAHASPHGQRPSETVVPLCEVRGYSADLTYAVGQETALAGAIAGQTGVVLVSWEHHAITGIVRALLNDASWPNQWPDRFDLVWLLVPSGTSYTFSEANQHLLSGDQ